LPRCNHALQPDGFEESSEFIRGEDVNAVDGKDAIAVFDANQDIISAVVCDMVMPKLGGAEVAQHISSLRPDVPILISSGYDEDALAKLNADNIAGFIHKPYMPSVLIAEVCRALGIE
jgi:CheY-like chemotaxis protein